MSNNYLENVLQKYKTYSWDQLKAESKIRALLVPWAGSDLNNLITIGSTIQGTAIKKGPKDLDLDILISFHSTIPHSLKEIHKSLFDYLKSKGLKPVKRNISIRVEIDKVNIDLVPAIKQLGGEDHTVYSRKKDQEFNSNPLYHAEIVKQSGRQKEIRLAKIWVYVHNVEMESLLLTLCVIEALKNMPQDDLMPNFAMVLEYLSNRFLFDKYADPCEPRDVLSDHLTDAEKEKIAELAQEHWHKQVDEVLF